MITRSELCTNPEREESAPVRLPPWLWDSALALGALAYLLLALFDGMDSPLMGLLVIVAVGRRLLRHRR